MGIYMKNRRGFTLLEVLIAAAIMSILALMATAAYKRSISVTRIEDSKNRVRVVANAVLRFKWDYPNKTLDPDHRELLRQLDTATCAKAGSTYRAGTLIDCEYLENRDWAPAGIKIVICDGQKLGELCSKSPVNNPLACMTGNSSRLSDDYRYDTQSYVFCVSEAAEGESRG